MNKTVAVLAAAALLALTACSDEGDSAGESASSPTLSREDQARANISSGLMEADGGFGSTSLTEGQANCLADSMVDHVGVDKLQRYDILDQDLVIQPDVDPSTLEPRDAEAMANALLDCVDVGELVFDRMGESADRLSDAQRQCLEDTVDENALRRALVDGFQGQPSDLSRGLQRNMMTCMTAGG